ncbi:uncharacterized protein LOC113217622 [Frankliniella occidentalis]|uniref:Uncharacterized protein LOC113217622 n=1 Tax=Frankliniella occidentalis TaxID=133901 RepID=A0A9C6TSY4_FRAOC|nr:uncharacterized protein LOC113217622 [Frankliniella occidentalis]
MESGHSQPAGMSPSSEDARKSARVLVMVVGCFSATYTPMCVLLASRMAGLRGDALDLAFSLSFTLANVNSLLNPFIYSWQNVTVRTAIRHLLRSFRRAGAGLVANTTPASSSSGRAELQPPPRPRRGPGASSASDCTRCAVPGHVRPPPPASPGVDVLA